MKLLTKLFISLFLIIGPVAVSADNSFPTFPMAFWGNVTLNGNPAPIGTVVKAYYGSTLAGTATVTQSGVYGYTESTKQKLLVDEGVGQLSFKVQSPVFGGGIETAGISLISYTGFTSGLTVQKNLDFTLSSSRSSGGGGGGGGGGYTSPSATSTVLPNSKVITGCDKRATGFSLTTGESCIGNIVTGASASIGEVLSAMSFHFTISLQKGMKGNEVMELQKFLNAAGYDCGVADGSFGAKVKAALIKFQIANKLKGDGIVGPKVRALLNK